MLAGQDPASFPNFTLREIGVVLDASALRDARQAWLSAQYARFAYHQPNDMPERPAPAVRSRAQDASDLAYVRAWMKAMHNNSRDHRNGD